MGLELSVGGEVDGEEREGRAGGGHERKSSNPNLKGGE